MATETKREVSGENGTKTKEVNGYWIFEFPTVGSDLQGIPGGNGVAVDPRIRDTIEHSSLG